MDLEKRVTDLEKKMNEVISTITLMDTLFDMQEGLMNELADAFCLLADQYQGKKNPHLEKYYQTVKELKNNFKVHKIQEEEK